VGPITRRLAETRDRSPLPHEEGVILKQIRGGEILLSDETADREAQRFFEQILLEAYFREPDRLSREAEGRGGGGAVDAVAVDLCVSTA
jgi:hypothetical protein